jgi:hypothetical protein
MAQGQESLGLRGGVQGDHGGMAGCFVDPG